MERVRVLFFLTSLTLLAVSILVPLQDHLREWRRIQRDYSQIAAKPVSTAIHHGWDQELGYLDRCTTCHLALDNKFLRAAKQPFRTHPTVPHNMREMGCTVCHRGQGSATSSLAAHGRAGRTGDLMLPGPYLEASCGRCHVGDTVPEAEVLNAGRLLIQKAGCAGCHRIAIQPPRTPIGPNLDGIGSKVRALWLFRWLKSPKDYRERTYMPNLLLPDRDAQLLTVFLMSQKGVVPDAKILSDSTGVARGQFRFRQIRCISCHSQNGRGGTFAPDLGRIGGKVRSGWLALWLRDPKLQFPQTRMPHFRLSEDDLTVLPSYMLSEFADSSTDERHDEEFVHTLPPPTRENLAAGRKLLLRSGCMGCHTLKGVEEQPKLGPELLDIGSREVDRLDFGGAPIERTLWSWLSAKLKSPRAFGKNLKMGDFRFEGEQVRQVVTALLSFTGKSLPPRYVSVSPKSAALRPQGGFGKILERYQCLSCHRIRGEGGTIAPDLSIIGSQAKPQWLAAYFRLPYSQRPMVKERMLQLGISEEEIETTVSYFGIALLDDSIGREALPTGRPHPQEIARGRDLYYNTYGCEACHQIGLSGGYVGPPLDGIGQRLYSGYILEYLKRPQRLKPDGLEPDNHLSEEEARALTAYLVSLPPAKARRPM